MKKLVEKNFCLGKPAPSVGQNQFSQIENNSLDPIKAGYSNSNRKSSKSVLDWFFKTLPIVIRGGISGVKRKGSFQTEEPSESECFDGHTSVMDPTKDDLKEYGESFPVFTDFLSISFPFIDEPETLVELKQLFQQY